MNRYIDFEIAREYLHKACESLGGNGGLMLKIKFDEEQTADVVEVVRCKECENWDRHWISSTFTENSHLCVVLDNVFDGEFYCACGHRRRSF